MSGRQSGGSETHDTYGIRCAFPAGSFLGDIGIILQLQRVQPVLILVGHGLYLINRVGHVEVGRGRRWRNAILSIFGLLLDDVPAVRAGLLALTCAVLVLGEIMGAFIKELRVDFHKHLHGVVYHAVNCSRNQVLIWCYLLANGCSMSLPIPVSLGVFVKRSKHDGKNGLHVVTDKVAEILIVPEI